MVVSFGYQAYQKLLPETIQVVVFDVNLIELILFF
jgi:hypothetical protein